MRDDDERGMDEARRKDARGGVGDKPKRKCVNAAKKPWQTPEWKEKRNKLIEGKSCEWCGSKENLCVHHKEPKIPYLLLYKVIENQLLTRLVEQGTYKFVLKNACPKCHHFSLSTRKTILPKYRCATCDFTFDIPVQFPTGKISEGDFRDFISKFNDVIKGEIETINQVKFERYMNFVNVMILCKRCHIAIGQGKILCKVCKKHYHARRYEKCSVCTPITPYVAEQIGTLSHYEETRKQDQTVIREFLQVTSKQVVDVLTLKEGLALVQKLKEVKIPVKMACGKIVSLSKEVYEDEEMDGFFECAYCIEDHNQDHCAYDETDADESSE